MQRHFWMRSSTFLVPILGAAYFVAGAGPAFAKGPQLAIGKKDCQRLAPIRRAPM